MRRGEAIIRLPGLDQDSATISPCGRYRYALTRGWGSGFRATWIMLNPSTADASLDDPTIRRCKSFSSSWGCGALTVVNLYAWRATDPAQLKLPGRDIIGPDNDDTIRAAVIPAARYGWPVIAAWGANADIERAGQVTEMVERAGVVLKCLGATKSGHPRHPLRLDGRTPLEMYRHHEAKR